MKSYVIAGLAAAQCILCAQPAAAAGFEQSSTVRSGTFAGMKIRLSLGGRQHDRNFRAGLTFAPSLRSQTVSGESQMRIGEGLEFGVVGKRPLAFSLAGRPIGKLLPGASKSEDDQRVGASTGGKIAIGAGVIALVAGAVVLGIVISQSDDAPDES